MENSPLFECKQEFKAKYVGGRSFSIAVDENTNGILSRGGKNSFKLWNPTDGGIIRTWSTEGIEGEEGEDEVHLTCFAPSQNSNQIITYNTNNIFEVWESTDVEGQEGRTLLRREWKAHSSPIVIMAHHATSPLLATASVDHSIRVWDSEKTYCTHNFRGVHGSVPSFLTFHPNPSFPILFSASEDGSIAMWDLRESKLIRSFKGFHSSPVTSLSISPSGKYLLSVGRDQIINIWDLDKTNKSSNPTFTIASLESMEAACFISEDEYITGGQEGFIRKWKVGKMQHSSKSSNNLLTSTDQSIVQILFSGGVNASVFTSALDIVQLNVNNLESESLYIGHHREITDLTLANQNLYVGTSSGEIRTYRMDDTISVINSWKCDRMKGHQQAIICLSSNSSFLLSGSRDHSAILWDLKEGKQLQTFSGHTDSISAVALSPKSTNYAATASSDLTLKMWKVSAEGANVKLLWTIKAHDKDINSITFTPNEKFLLTASQDKTIKVWKVNDGTLIKTITGHKRGIWHVSLSPKEQLLATCSADKSIKLWSVTEDYKCLRTLEGHSMSVLRTLFTHCGTKLISTSADGMIKVWDVKKGECLCTIDAHEDRIWTSLLTLSGNIISADASGGLKIWEDVTELRSAEALMKKNEITLKEQDLQNYLIRKEFSNALLLAIELEQPSRAFAILGEIINSTGFDEAVAKINEIVSQFTSEQIKKLLQWLREWNTSFRRSYVTQVFLKSLLSIYSKEKNTLDEVSRDICTSQILPYVTSHIEKLDELQIGSHMADFILINYQK